MKSKTTFLMILWAVLMLLSGCGGPAVSVPPASDVQADMPTEINGLPVVLRAELPPEAHDTLDLIHAGGPFPYRKDGSTFQNREGLLPDQPRGYYREYTVDTPGSPDRGARRIVAGDRGEFYYTADHYASFAVIWDP